MAGNPLASVWYMWEAENALWEGIGEPGVNIDMML